MTDLCTRERVAIDAELLKPSIDERPKHSQCGGRLPTPSHCLVVRGQCIKARQMWARMFDGERVEEGELRLWHLQSTSWVSPPTHTHPPTRFLSLESMSARMCVLLSLRWQDSPPLWARRRSITAKLIYCTDSTSGWETRGLPGITGLWLIYTSRLLSAKRASDTVWREKGRR